MLKNLLKFASAYQGLAFSVLFVLEIWVHVLILKYDLKVFTVNRLSSIPTLVMNLSLALFFYNAAKVVGNESGARDKFQFWGKCSILTVGIVQLLAVFFPKQNSHISYLENADSLSNGYEALAFLFQHSFLAYQILDIFSSSSNLLFTTMIYLFVNKIVYGDRKDQKCLGI